MGFFEDGLAVLVVCRKVVEFFDNVLPRGNQFVFTIVGEAFEVDGILADFDLYVAVVFAVDFNFAIFAAIVGPVGKVRDLEGKFDFEQIFVGVLFLIELLDEFSIISRFEIIKQPGIARQIKQAYRQQYYGRQSFQRLVLVNIIIF